MKYQDILNRIIEILILSEQKRKELESLGITDIGKKLNERNFEGYHPFVIYKEYYQEFEYLKNKELTFCLLTEDREVGLKNHLLLSECRERLATDTHNKQDLEDIIKILEKSNGMKADNLMHIVGYFVPETDYEVFKEKCYQLKIGPCKEIAKNKEEFLIHFEKNRSEIDKQRKRIIKHFKKSIDKREIEEELIDKEVFIDAKKKEINNSDNLQCEENLDINLEGKFKEIIYLGMLGHLNIKMVSELKTILKENEFKELINVLKQNGIFTESDLLEIELEANKKVKTITDIDELVAYFAVRKNLNVAALKVLIPSIGIDNYHYLMDQLFRFNAIDIDAYKKYLEEFNLIDNSFKQAR